MSPRRAALRAVNRPPLRPRGREDGRIFRRALTIRAIPTVLGAIACLLVFSTTAPARAAAPAPAGTPADDLDTYSHVGQVGLRVGLALPFKVNFRFDDSPPCDIDASGQDKKVCPIAAPVALDLALSYGLSGTVEPFIWGRFGLNSEAQTNTEATTLLGAGLRLYTVRDARLKAFLEPSLGAQFEGPVVALPGRNYETDVLARLHFGGQYDFRPNFGGFVTLGPNVSFVRALSLGIELNFGVQARLP